GPTSMAQDDPGTAAPTDQELPPAPCPVPLDARPSDDVLDDNAAPTCTPTPDSGPSDAPTDAPTSAPTATPAPTDVPRPTDTPQPAAPTDTQTPVPTVATETPIPTSGSKEPPVGTLSRQLPFANPTNDECDFDLSIPDPQACDGVPFPAALKISFSPYASNAPITVQVDDRKPEMVKSSTWDFLSVPGGVGPGTHTITASETIAGTPLSAKLSVQVQKATSPHLLVFPRHLAAGHAGKIFLAGFPPETVFPLGVYRERQDCDAYGQGNECFELSRELGTIKTNADGTIVRDFSVPANEKPTAYLISTPGLNIDSKNVANSLKALGRPWFVVN
ncbi:MAG: hypothetical protein ACR2IK_02340, partial [Chloroflexota bacterium]